MSETRLNAPQLRRLVERGGQFTESKSSVPILRHVMLWGGNERVHAASTDLSVAFCSTMATEANLWPWEGPEWIVGANREALLAALAIFPNSVKVELEPGTLILTGGAGSRAVVPLIVSDKDNVNPACDLFTRRDQAEKVCELTPSSFARALKTASLAMSSDDTRPVLAAVLMRFPQFGCSDAVLTATDTHRLTIVECDAIPMQERGSVTEILVPATSVKPLIRFADTCSGRITVRVTRLPNGTPTSIFFETPTECFETRIVEGQFPRIERVIPSEKDLAVSVEMRCEDLKLACQQVKPFTSHAPAKDRVIVSLRQDADATFEADTEVGSIVVPIAGKSTQWDWSDEDGPYRFAVNSAYLRDAVSELSECAVSIRLQSTALSAMLLDCPERRTRTVLMPMQLH